MILTQPRVSALSEFIFYLPLLLILCKVYFRSWLTRTCSLKCCFFCRVYGVHSSHIKHSFYNLPFLRPFPHHSTILLCSRACLLFFSIQERRLITARYWMTTRCMRKLERGASARCIWRPTAKQTFSMPSSSWTWHRHVSKSGDWNISSVKENLQMIIYIRDIT